MVLRRLRGFAAPFASAARVVNPKRYNSVPLACCCVFMVILVAAIASLRLYAFIPPAKTMDIVDDIKQAIRASVKRKDAPEVSRRVPVPRGDTYAMSTEEFINDLKRMDKTRAFEWHFDSPSAIHFATYSPPRPFLKVMVVGQLHARELYSADVARYWMASIMAQTPALLNDYVALRNHSLSEWTFVPVANPCGRDAAVLGYTALMYGGATATANVTWGACHRGNCAGVDLNRNWITYGASLYKKTSGVRLKRGRFWDGSPETNPGPEAFSEPESSFLRSLIHEMKPHLVISLHTGGVGFLHPPEDKDTETDLHSRFSHDRLSKLRSAAGWARSRSGVKPREQRHMEDTMVPVAGGSLLDYCVRHEVPLALTVELYVDQNISRAGDLGASAPEYHGTERWGTSPLACHRFYNPPQALLLDSANRWLRLWKALFYLKASERAFFADLLEWRRDQP